MSGASERILRIRSAIAIAAMLAAWEIVGRFELIANGAFPAPTAILSGLWADSDLYWRHISASVRSASLGFVIGNVIAVLMAVLFVQFPATERLMSGINITLFAMPLIAVVPVLVLAFDGSTPQVVLAAVAVYYPTMSSMLLGLRNVDDRLVDAIRGFGGGSLAILRRVRLRAALPALTIGLRTAAPAAVLGSLLAEFGSGSRWGLGTFLLGSLGAGDPARLWGIGLVATGIAGVGYGVFALVAKVTTRQVASETLATSPVPASGSREERPVTRFLYALASLIVALGAWQLLLAVIDLNPILTRSPAGVVRFLFTEDGSGEARARLVTALGETLPAVFWGLAAGLVAAFVFAVVLTLLPSVGRSVLPFALISQTMPLVAFTPLIALVFGRGAWTTIVVTISVTFFPSFVTIAQGLAMTPRRAVDVVQIYGGSKLTVLRLVSVPSAVPYLLAAARLAAPRALLGVMVAEWLATGRGLGNLLNESRGRLDFGMIWSVAAVSVVVAIALYRVFVAIDQMVMKRYLGG